MRKPVAIPPHQTVTNRRDHPFIVLSCAGADMVGKDRFNNGKAAEQGPVPVAQYMRMSTEHQRYSTENQSLAIAEYAQRNGMQVVRIYKLFLDDGMPERVIASALNRQQIPSDFGRPWSRGTVHQILTNEKYIGNNVYNRTSFKLKVAHRRNEPSDWIRKDGAFEAIVPVDRFDKVQAVIAAPRCMLTRTRCWNYSGSCLTGVVRSRGCSSMRRMGCHRAPLTGIPSAACSGRIAS